MWSVMKAVGDSSKTPKRKVKRRVRRKVIKKIIIGQLKDGSVRKSKVGNTKIHRINANHISETD